jgi:hypothetical protein
MEPLAADGRKPILLAERLRLHPETTSVYEREIDESSGSTLYESDPKDYMDAFTAFLDQYFP